MGRKRVEGLGLKELRARTPPGECPFCGEPCERKAEDHEAVLRRKRNRVGQGRSYFNGGSEFKGTCGDEICHAAYQTYYARDRRRTPLTQAQKDRNNAVRRANYAKQKEGRT